MADVQAARRALEASLGEDEVLSDPTSLRLYARDASMVEGAAALVAFPRTEADVVSCLRVAREHGLNVVGGGGGPPPPPPPEEKDSWRACSPPNLPL